MSPHRDTYVSTPIAIRLRRRLALGLAVVASAGMMLVGLPATASAAPGDYAKITSGGRCDKMHLKKTFPRTPNNSGAPTGQHHWTRSGPDEEYYYNNDFKGFENVPTPTQADLNAAGSSRADIDKWDAEYARSKDPEDMKRAIYARYHRHKKESASPKPFRSWVPRYLINNQANGAKGGVFERKTVQDFNLVGPDWLCEVTIEIYDKDGNKIASRRYDAYNQRTGDLGEFKSNGKRKIDQFRNDKIILRHKDAKYDFTKSKFTMFTGEKPNGVTSREYAAENKALRAERGTGNNPIRIAERRATGKGLWPQTKYTKSYPVFNPRPNTGTQGPINSLAYQSGKNPAQARQIQAEHNRVDTRSALGRGPGGVDFSTLELQYVGNPVKGKGMDYSMKADFMPDEDTNPGWGGEAKLTLASDAFFTWLALSPDRMWVNLNPDQPDKIMDKAFGETDAGRILLEADMEMKRDWSRALDPKKSPGREFMAAAPKVDGVPCWGPGRNWIVPDRAKVREQDGGIYILDAPLKVNHAPMDFTTPVPGERCDKKLTEAEKEYSVRLMKQWIIPAVQEKVNKDPKYQDLRSVYRSRVAAEWIRQQDAKKPTDFRPVIDSNNLERWRCAARTRTGTSARYGSRCASPSPRASTSTNGPPAAPSTPSPSAEWTSPSPRSGTCPVWSSGPSTVSFRGARRTPSARRPPPATATPPSSAATGRPGPTTAGPTPPPRPRRRTPGSRTPPPPRPARVPRTRRRPSRASRAATPRTLTAASPTPARTPRSG